jgi:viroplasmin and RNaseH domain-containing protein
MGHNIYIGWRVQMANEKNLIPIQKGQLSKEEAKKRGSAGGKKSVKVRREKKIISEIHAEIIAEMYGLKIKKGSSLKDIIKDILSRRDSASVSMLKELREATEGSKINLTNDIEQDEAVKAIIAKHGIKIRNN